MIYTSTPDNANTYDELNRLTQPDYLIGLLTEDKQFTYDDLGNRESVNLRDGTDQDYAVNTLTNCYDNNAGEDIVCVYDNAGNTTTDPNGYQYTYDYENRIIEIKDKDSVSIVEYTYDALGRRIQKEDKITDETTRYYYNNSWQVLLETDYDDQSQTETDLRSYFYGNYMDEVLVMTALAELNDPNYYYTHDHLYSPVALLEDDGTVVERYEYNAYGQPTIWDSTFSSERDTTNYNNPYLFTGRRVDVLDSGDYVVQFSRERYYDYDTGRMLSQDCSGYGDGMNLYQYVGSNPIIFIDPWGLRQSRVAGEGGDFGFPVPDRPKEEKGTFYFN